MRKRRSLKQLRANIKKARTKSEEANAWYELALFYDNNSRERETISFYQKAIELGLEKGKKAEALAWLASSFYKTGRYEKALASLNRSLRINNEEKIISFLARLKKRILKKIHS